MSSFSVLGSASRDVHCLIAMRFIRLLAFGMSSLTLVLFFNAIGFSTPQIGTFMTLTLIGDLAISYFLTLHGDELGKRNVLMFGSALMMFSGVLFVVSSNYNVLLFAAIIGVVPPGGQDIGPFKAIEESALAHLTSLASRTHIFAWHTGLGDFGTALGAIIGGSLVEFVNVRYGFSMADSYRAIYVVYALLGLAKLIITMMLSSEVEGHDVVQPRNNAIDERTIGQDSSDVAASTENSALLASQPPNQSPRRRGRLLPHLSHESTKIVYMLSLLFAVDTLASSLVTTSWTTYYISHKFTELTSSTLGSIFFTTGLISSAVSFIGAAISTSLGPILTMVCTHLPSSCLLIFVPYPSDVRVTMLLLILRACTSRMDVAPRQTFLSSVVLKSERTAVLAWVNMIKTLSSSLGPLLAGWLTGLDLQWTCFVLAGALKVIYDLGILARFVGMQLKE